MTQGNYRSHSSRELNGFYREFSEFLTLKIPSPDQFIQQHGHFIIGLMALAGITTILPLFMH